MPNRPCCVKLVYQISTSLLCTTRIYVLGLTTIKPWSGKRLSFRFHWLHRRCVPRRNGKKVAASRHSPSLGKQHFLMPPLPPFSLSGPSFLHVPRQICRAPLVGSLFAFRIVTMLFPSYAPPFWISLCVVSRFCLAMPDAALGLIKHDQD